MIDSFHGEHRFLSNFWPAEVVLDGVTYPSVEHAYVAAKTLDLEHRKTIASIPSPGKVKREGRSIELRSDWSKVKLSIMTDLVIQKFNHPELRDLLSATGDQELVEGNTWGDVYWGVCRGKGSNHLGKILMEIRRVQKCLR